MIEILSGGRGIGKTQNTVEFAVKKLNEAKAENKRLKEAIKKAREELEAIATEADFADYNNLSCGEEMSTETAKCEAEDISMGVKLDDILEVFDKYLEESEKKELYTSPIEKIYGELQTQIVQEDEKMVMKAIREVGVNVDKETLIKALQYDRNQYTKGYEDGKNNVLDKIRAEIIELRSKQNVGVFECLDILGILDKYKAESEEKHGRYRVGN